jgi:hypothetical protein
MRFLLAIIASLACLTGNAAFFDNHDWEAAIWRSNVVVVGSSVSGSTYVDSVRLVQMLKGAGIRSRICRLNHYSGNDVNAVKCPILWSNAFGGSLDQVVNFVGGDYTEATGLTGDTSSKYVAPTNDLAFNAFFQNDLHFGVYCRTDSTSAGYVMGAQDTGTQSQVAMLLKYVDGNTYFRIGDVATYIATNQTSVLGWHVGVRVSNTSCIYYQNGVAGSAYSPGANTMPPEGMCVHAANVNGARVFSARTLAGYTLGNALSATLNANYYTLIQWYQKRRGRAV